MTHHSGTPLFDRIILTIVGVCAIANIAALGLGHQFWIVNSGNIGGAWVLLMALVFIVMDGNRFLSRQTARWVAEVGFLSLLLNTFIMWV